MLITARGGTRIFRRIGVGRAALFSILTQGWSVFAGIVTLFVITRSMSSIDQGFYYTFSSVLALQVFVELGLTTVIVQMASHEWAFLKRKIDGTIFGDSNALSRLASLVNFSLKWYVISGLLVTVGLGVGGYWFFSIRPHPEVPWLWPWFSLCGIAGLALMLSPILSVIEGCNQVASIYSFRLVQGILSSLALILGIYAGWSLYALAFSAGVRLSSSLVFVLWKHSVFIRQLLQYNIHERIKWKKEVWPFQWRIAISWLSGFFVFSLFNPVMFHFHGPKIAGQMGMTLAIISAIEGLSSPVLNTRVPEMGILIAKREYVALDILFRRLVATVLCVAGSASLGILLVISVPIFQEKFLSDRILPFFLVLLLIVQRILNIGISSLALYLRAHKKEPLMLVSLSSALLVGVSTLIFGALYGPAGASVGYLVITIFWMLPACCYIFQRSRKLWHQESFVTVPID